jgi:hypothetical protein
VLTKFSISAPVKPGVIWARIFAEMLSLFIILSKYSWNMSYLPFTSGCGTWIFLSNLPGLVAA